KYAFEGIDHNKKIEVCLDIDDNKMVSLRISDNGVGIPEDLDIKNSRSLGLLIVNSLVGQLEGEMSIDRTKGTTFTITFNESEEHEFVEEVGSPI
ncbi:ATP-binding protein, partial [Nitrospirota bacterium]